MSGVAAQRLPESPSDWQKLIQARQLQNISLAQYPNIRSASEIDFNQFLLLRVVWPEPLIASQFLPEKGHWIALPPFNEAKSLLKKCDSWRRYLDHLEHRSRTSRAPDEVPELGSFSLVSYYFSTIESHVSSTEFSKAKIEFTPIANRTRQATLQVASSARQPQTPATPTRAGGQSSSAVNLDIFGDLTLGSTATPPTLDAISPVSPASGDARHLQAIDDEQIVNTALILFLNAITIHFKTKADWTLHRRRFLYNDISGAKIYEARVDGFLRSRQDGQARGIVEVKPYMRADRDSIRMQEAGQMAAWISEYPPAGRGRFRRLLISQDRHEIYLNFAEFDSDYVDYVRGIRTKNLSFLKMKEYGPFLTDNLSHMRALAPILLAWTLQECKY